MEQNLKQFLMIVLSPVGMGQEPEGRVGVTLQGCLLFEFELHLTGSREPSDVSEHCTSMLNVLLKFLLTQVQTI